MNYTILFLLILINHFVADFLAQTDKQAKAKSSSNRALFMHVLTYSLIWFPSAMYLLDRSYILVPIFISITFCAHFITDYITSRLVKKQFDKQNFHNGFVFIGLDQMLHYLQLWFTFIWLSSFI